MDPIEAVLSDPSFIERFEVGPKIGEGGMGVVYRAVQRSLDRPVAIKFMHGALAETRSFQERFLAEAKMAAGVIHTNVVAVFDRGVCNGVPYLVTELVEGEPLTNLLNGGRPMEPARALAIARQVLSGLQALHTRGILHRDLKPSNILIAPGPVAKVLDFGIAKPLNEAAAPGRAKTAAGIIVGTPQYMSPEQSMGRELTPASDLYSLTVVLYEMLTGRPPFDAGSSIEILTMHLREPPAIPPELPGPLAELLGAGLEKEPSQRLGNAESYMRAIDRAATSEAAPLAFTPKPLARASLEPTAVSRRTPPAPEPSRAEEPGGSVKAVSPGWLALLAGLTAMAALFMFYFRSPVRTLPGNSPPWMLRLEQVRDTARRGQLGDAIRTFFAVTRSMPSAEAAAATGLATSPVLAHTDRTLLVLLERCARHAGGGGKPIQEAGETGKFFSAMGLAIHDRDLNRIVTLTDDWLTRRRRHSRQEADPDAASLGDVNAFLWLSEVARMGLASRPWLVISAFGGLHDQLLSHADGAIPFWSARLEIAAMPLASVPASAAWIGARLAELEAGARAEIAFDELTKLGELVEEVRRILEDRWREPTAAQIEEARRGLLAEMIGRRISGYGWQSVPDHMLREALEKAGRADLADQMEKAGASIHVSNPPANPLLCDIAQALDADTMGVIPLLGR